MERLTRLVISRPTFVFAALLLVSGAAVWQAGKLRVSAGADQLMLAKDPNKAFYNIAQETFGSDNVITLFVEAKDLFSAKKLKLLQGVGDSLAEIEGVTRIDSLFTLRSFERSNGGLTASPMFDPFPSAESELDELRQKVLRNPFVRNLLSSDATAMAFYVYARRAPTETGFDSRLVEQIERAIAPLKQESVAFVSDDLPFDRIFQMGAPVVRSALTDTLIADQRLLVALLLGVVVVFLVGIHRSASGLFLPLLIAGVSILWIVGLMATVGLPVNTLTALVPLLVVLLGTIQSSHLLRQYSAGLIDGNDKRAALLYMAGRLGVGFFVTFAIVFLAFLSLVLNDIKIVKQFGVVASLGLLFNLVVTLVLAPLYLLAFGGARPTAGAGGGEERSVFERVADALPLVMAKNKSRSLAVVVVVTLVLGGGVIWLKTNNDPRAFFAQDSLIQTRSNTIAERLHGVQTFAIVFSTRSDGAFEDPDLLHEIKKVRDYIRQMELFDTTLSLVDLLSMFNREMNGGDDQYFRIPVSRELTQKYLTVLSSGDDMEHYVSADFRQATIRVWHNLSNSHDFSRALSRLREFTDTLDKRLRVRLSGEDVLINDAANSLLSGQAKSILSFVLIVIALVSLLFMSFKAGLIAVAPNLIAVVVLFGVLGFFGIPLDIGTAMIATVTIAIGVSHTLCFMIRYNAQVREDEGGEQAMERTVRLQIAPIIATSVLFVLGFVLWLAADLKPIAHFGGLTALLILVTLLANLLVTPSLLTSMRFVTLWGMATMDVGRKIIEGCELFNAMHSWQIKQVILMSQVREVDAGEVFIQQGAVGNEMFVILEGNARVEIVDAEGNNQIVNHAFEGDVIGELALVSHEERMATVVAETDLKLLVLEWETLEQLSRYLPMISARLFLNIARIIGKRFAG